jgi:hypothetical protein
MATPKCTPVPVVNRLPGNGQPVVATVAPSAPAVSGAASAGNSRKEILAKLMAGQISEDQADELLAALENTTTGRHHLYCRVSAKSALSVYGLHRMPVTLYVEQWEALLRFVPQIQAFITANNAKFARKQRS